GDPGLVLHDRDAAAGQPVEQRGLADVGTADDGDDVRQRGHLPAGPTHYAPGPAGGSISGGRPDRPHPPHRGPSRRGSGRSGPPSPRPPAGPGRAGSARPPPPRRPAARRSPGSPAEVQPAPRALPTPKLPGSLSRAASSGGARRSAALTPWSSPTAGVT